MTGNDSTDDRISHDRGGSDGLDEAPGDTHLRWQLRGMRQDLPPQRDLWPQIAARIRSTRASSTVTEVPRRSAALRQARPRWAPLALAASLLLAVGIAWQMRPLPEGVASPPVQTARSSARRASAKLLPREAEAMAREYDAALQELQAATPQGLQPRVETAALQELDRSADQIRDALRRDPGARFLFERLRRTYAQRLALIQRNTLT